MGKTLGGGGEFREKGKLRWNVLHTGLSWPEGKLQAVEQVRTNYVSLSLTGGSKDSATSMYTQHFHQWEPNAGLEGRLWRKAEAAREMDMVVLWQSWQRIRTPDHYWQLYLQWYPRGYEYIWKCTKGMNGKREAFLNQSGISLKEATLCSKKSRQPGSERPAFKSQLSQFLICDFKQGLSWVWAPVHHL